MREEHVNPRSKGNIDSRPIHPGIARGILQGEAGITRADRRQHILGSCGAMPCVILAIYNAATKAVALAHLDGLADPSCVVVELKEALTVTRSSDDVLDAYIAGGNILCDVKKRLAKSIDAHKQLRTQLEIQSTSLAVDAKNGRIYTAVGKAQLDHGKDVFKRQAEYFWRAFVDGDPDIRIVFQPNLAADYNTKKRKYNRRQAMAFRAFWRQQMERVTSKSLDAQPKDVDLT